MLTNIVTKTVDYFVPEDLYSKYLRLEKVSLQADPSTVYRTGLRFQGVSLIDANSFHPPSIERT